jgi:hypothetical protein
MKRKKKLRVYFSTETHKEHVVAYIAQKSLNNDLKRIEDEKSLSFFVVEMKKVCAYNFFV